MGLFEVLDFICIVLIGLVIIYFIGYWCLKVYVLGYCNCWIGIVIGQVEFGIGVYEGIDVVYVVYRFVGRVFSCFRSSIGWY